MKKIGLSGAQLKGIAILAMLIDHIAWVFVPMESPLGQIAHFIGRLTAPIMFYFIAEGFHYTRNVKRYIARLLIFGIIAQVPYIYVFNGAMVWIQLNVLFMLALGLAVLAGIKKWPRSWGILIAFAGVFLSRYVEWDYLGLVLILIFGLFREERNKTLLFALIFVAAFIAMEWTQYGFWNYLFEVGMLVPLLLLRLYNGERGHLPGGRWMFYGFYPAHLIVLGVLRFFLL